MGDVIILQNVDAVTDGQSCYTNITLRVARTIKNWLYLVNKSQHLGDDHNISLLTVLYNELLK